MAMRTLNATVALNVGVVRPSGDPARLRACPRLLLWRIDRC